MKGIELPEKKEEAGIQKLFLPKGDRGVHLIILDAQVKEKDIDVWGEDPDNRTPAMSWTRGERGRGVVIIVYAANEKVSFIYDAQTGPSLTDSIPIQATGWYAHNAALGQLRMPGHICPDSMVVLMRNKIDLGCQPDSQAESLRFFEQNGISADVVKKRVRFFDVSANTADGVSDALRSIGECAVAL